MSHPNDSTKLCLTRNTDKERKRNDFDSDFNVFGFGRMLKSTFGCTLKLCNLGLKDHFLVVETFSTFDTKQNHVLLYNRMEKYTLFQYIVWGDKGGQSPFKETLTSI